MNKETKLIIALAIVTLCLLMWLILLYFDTVWVANVLCKIINIILTGVWLKLFFDYRRIKKLKYALSSEVGFIARAIFHMLSRTKIKVDELKESFTVTNAIIHAVGADIAILDRTTSENILEFHSLMKVVINTLDISNNEKVIYLQELFYNLSEVVQKNKIAIKIVEESQYAKMGLIKATLRQVDLT